MDWRAAFPASRIPGTHPDFPPFFAKRYSSPTGGDMDPYLIEYLQSGKAWVMIGSGPSAQAGYPSWNQLANVALSAVRLSHGDSVAKRLQPSFDKNDYPAVFDA